MAGINGCESAGDGARCEQYCVIKQKNPSRMTGFVLDYRTNQVRSVVRMMMWVTIIRSWLGGFGFHGKLGLGLKRGETG